ncbi:hypothetical protein BJF89_02225 [Corynebacterium sp. CNJ-954]|nr:hypothetical protein BJF89_02225 [Corynebacterium sp. CNJ-954]
MSERVRLTPAENPANPVESARESPGVRCCRKTTGGGAGELEQKRLAMTDVGDRVLGFGVHVHMSGTSVVLRQQPTFCDEHLEGVGEFVLSCRSQNRSLTPSGEGRPLTRWCQILELR